MDVRASLCTDATQCSPFSISAADTVRIKQLVIVAITWLFSFTAVGQNPIDQTPILPPSVTNSSSSPETPMTVTQTPDTAQTEKPAIPAIASEPKFIDRGQFLPPQLSKLASVDLRGRSLQELFDWIRLETGMTILIDNSELQTTSILLTDTYSDWLDQAPIYYLLDRLQQINLGWYTDEDIIYVTSRDKSVKRYTSVAYNLGELLDKGFSSNSFVEMMPTIIAPSEWSDSSGDGRIDLIGDMLFVRNTVEIQMQIQGLLQALGQPAEQTYVSDSAANEQLRTRMEMNVAAEFRDMPLVDIFTELANRAKVDLRLERDVVDSRKIRSRELINFSMGERPLKSVLQFLLTQHQLTVTIRDGVIWVGRETDDKMEFSTAVYDVRDLCRDRAESEGLTQAIESQMPGVWSDDGGDSKLEFFQPGTMVVWATSESHRDLLLLLRRYRTALLNSKPRQATAESDAVLTRYYRLHASLAMELKNWIPGRIQPESWLTAEKPNAIGTIEIIESIPESVPVSASSTATDSKSFVAVTYPFKTLVIRQHESVHDQIVDIIWRIEHGDLETQFSRIMQKELRGSGGGGFGGGGFGGAGFGRRSQGSGFGGGYFRVPPSKLN